MLTVLLEYIDKVTRIYTSNELLALMLLQSLDSASSADASMIRLQIR